MTKQTQAKSKTVKAEAGEKLSFEAALHRLEEIVSQLEQADAPLDKALTLYEEGVKLSRLCSQQLQDAERRVEILEDKNGQLRGRPLGGAAGDNDLENGDEEYSDEDEESETEIHSRPTRDTLF
jgi:exodeoxyribonuclease VII small subunit